MFFLIFASICFEIKYSSSIQLKNQYTFTRLSTTVNNAAQAHLIPKIFASGPPFEDGWNWIPEPSNSDSSMARTSIKCGSNISLFSSVSQYFLSIRKQEGELEIFPSTSNDDSRSYWTVICEKGENWENNLEIQLKNVKYECYLSTFLSDLYEETENQFYAKCSPLSPNAVWVVNDGVFILDSKVENTHDEEL